MKLLWTALLATLPLTAFEYGLKPSKVSERIYCFFGAAEVMNKHNNGNMVNSCFVDMLGSWLVIDSGPTHNYAKEAYRVMKKVKKQPVKYVVNTHIHDDHWLGNSFYKEIGATIVGSALFKESVDVNAPTRMQNRITKAAYAGTKPTLPNMMIRKEVIKKIEDEELHLIHVKQKAHTASDIMVYIPSLKALFAGDVIFSDRLPSLRDGGITAWITLLEKLEQMSLEYLIGGHGSVTGIESTLLTKTYLQSLKTAVADAIDEGVEIADAVKKIELEAFQTKPMYRELHRQNIDTAYRQLEWGDE